MLFCDFSIHMSGVDKMMKTYIPGTPFIMLLTLGDNWLQLEGFLANESGKIIELYLNTGLHFNQPIRELYTELCELLSCFSTLQGRRLNSKSS